MTQENVEDAVDRFVGAQMDSQHIPGLSLAVVRGGAVIRARGYGFASLELNVRVTPQTVFQIGSLTKQFTAVAVMMLVGEGRVGLGESITRTQDGLPPAWGGVTVRHLLDHTSGIKSFTSLPDVMARLTFLPASRDEVLALVAGEPLEFAPGERYAYNNTGYYLLGHIIEQASGQPYADFLRERIFAPLKMNATRVNDLKDILPDRACGYEWAEDRWRNADHISMTWPFSAGALVSTALDLARWDAALGSESLLPKAAWERMWTPATLNDGTRVDYGFGWAVGDYGGHRSLGHGGGIPGFMTYMERYPDDDLAVIVLTNVLPADPALIVRGVARHYVPNLQPPA
jgi:CubicO group peptidase (beta-lactamase class C family)